MPSHALLAAVLGRAVARPGRSLLCRLCTAVRSSLPRHPSLHLRVSPLVPARAQKFPFWNSGAILYRMPGPCALVKPHCASTCATLAVAVILGLSLTMSSRRRTAQMNGQQSVPFGCLGVWTWRVLHGFPFRSYEVLFSVPWSCYELMDIPIIRQARLASRPGPTTHRGVAQENTLSSTNPRESFVRIACFHEGLSSHPPLQPLQSLRT